MTEKERDLWEIAKGLKKFNWSQLRTAAKSKNKKLISSSLKKAEAHGLLERTDAGYKVLGTK